MCFKFKTARFNQQICSLGLKPLAVFAKYRADFEPLLPFEFTTAQIKGVNTLYKTLSRNLKTFTSDNHHSSNILEKVSWTPSEKL